MSLIKTVLFNIITLLLLLFASKSSFAQVTISGPSTICSGGTVTLCGTAGFTSYIWSTAEATPCIVVNSTNTFGLTVTDAVGATFSDSYGTTELPPPPITFNCIGYVCPGNPIQCSVNEAYATYAWSTGETTQSITIATPGTYSVTVTDVNGCTSTDLTNVTGSFSLFIVSTSDCGLCEGTASVFATGGSGPYTFLWDAAAGNQTGQTATGLCGNTSYTVTVTDATGCLVTESVFVLDYSFVSLSLTPLSSPLTSDGMASASLNGGLPPYSFLWSDGQTTPTAVGLSAGCYSVTVTNNTGCAATAMACFNDYITGLDSLCAGEVLTLCAPTDAVNPLWSNGDAASCTNYFNPSSTTISLEAFDPNSGHNITATHTAFSFPEIVSQTTDGVESSPGAVDGNVSVSANGGSPPYQFDWSDGQAGANPGGLTSGCYYVTITDNEGCLKVDTACVLPTASNLSLFYVNGNLNTCNQCIGEISVLAYGGDAPYSYLWSDNSTSASITGLCPGTHSVTITDNTGATITESYDVSATSGCVWPGDENNDQEVNMYDILSVGLAYGESGAVRPNTSIVWDGYHASDWASAHINGGPSVNNKHVDSNGDGIVTTDDTIAISLNYDSIYQRNGSLNGQIPLFIEGLGSYIPGDVLSLPIHLGSSTDVAEDVYGIAFSIIYDPSKVEDGSVNIDFSISWLDPTGTNLLSFSKNFSSIGRVDVAITRTDQVSVTGFGTIGHLQMTIRDDIFRGNVPFLIDVINSRLLDENGNEISVDEQELIIDINTGIGVVNTFDSNIKIFPNPVDNVLTLKIEDLTVQELSLYSVSGKLIYSNLNPASGELTISTESINNGVYYLTVKTDKGTVTKRVAILH